MTRIELKIPPPDRPSDAPKTCLLFRYLPVPAGSEIHRRRIEIGLPVLTQIGSELRSTGYEVTEPYSGKKSLGATSIKCHRGSDALGIIAWPPEGDDRDEWLIITQWLSKSKPPTESTHSDLDAWDEVRNAIANVVAKLKGSRDLRWVSYQDAGFS